MFESLLNLDRSKYGPVMTCAHFGLLQRLRLAHWCALGSLHSLCGQPQFAASVYTVCQRNFCSETDCAELMMCDDIWESTVDVTAPSFLGMALHLPIFDTQRSY